MALTPTTKNVKEPDDPPPGDGFVTDTLNAAPADAIAVLGTVTAKEVPAPFTLAPVRVLPLKDTVEAETKFAPVTVRVKASLPSATHPGDNDVIVGAGLLTVKVADEEIPPSGLSTVTAAVPGEATSPAEMAAVNCELLTKVVARLFPFHCTVALETKLLPFTVSVKSPEPAPIFAGESELIAGSGLMVKVEAAEVPLSGLTTVTLAVPAEATSLAEMAAVSCELFAKVVVRLFPFHCTVAPETKLLPFTVNVRAPVPAPTLFGESELIVGPPLTVKLEAADVPPSGLTTVTGIVPEAATSLAEMAAVILPELT